MDLKNLLNNYQEAFNSKNLTKLSDLFSDDITLKDWDISVHGKSPVLEANKKIFDSVNTINCKSIKNYYEKDTVICVLKIIINDDEIIDVVDIIEFNKDQKISSIRAYKG